jgi:uncharacterized protein with GYD domain
MATFVASIKFTSQGIQNIRDTSKRAAALKASAKKMGAKVKEIYWTLGPSDGLVVFEAPDDETATALMLHVASLGNVQTQTSRAFTAGEIDKVLASLPS